MPFYEPRKVLNRKKLQLGAELPHTNQNQQWIRGFQFHKSQNEHKTCCR